MVRVVDAGVETPPPFIPACTVGALQENGRVPVFASDGRNVTAAALSTLGGNSGLDGEAGAQLCQAACHRGVGMSWLASRPGWGQLFYVRVPTLLPATPVPPGSPSLSYAGWSHLTQGFFFFLFGGGGIYSDPCVCPSQGRQEELIEGQNPLLLSPHPHNR